MSQLYLFALASQKANWLHERQELVAENVANVNMPGYKATDMKPFSVLLDEAGEGLFTTNPAHFSLASSAAAPERPEPTDAPETTLSGNSVSLEGEMVKLGDINRSLSLNTNIQRIFHQMVMSALK